MFTTFYIEFFSPKISRNKKRETKLKMNWTGGYLNKYKRKQSIKDKERLLIEENIRKRNAQNNGNLKHKKLANVQCNNGKKFQCNYPASMLMVNKEIADNRNPCNNENEKKQSPTQSPPSKLTTMITPCSFDDFNQIIEKNN